MGVFGYIRVSTEQQATEGVSLDMQRQKIDAYCQLHDLTLSEIIDDEGISAKSLDRPGVQRFMAMVAAGDVNTIVVYKLDRLSHRTRDVLELVEVFEQHNVAFHSIQESLDTKSAVGRFVLRPLASLSEMARDLISERTKDPLVHLKSQGKKLGRSGYADQSMISYLKAEYSQGRSYHELAAELNTRGIQRLEVGCGLRQRCGTWY